MRKGQRFFESAGKLSVFFELITYLLPLALLAALIGHVALLLAVVRFAAVLLPFALLFALLGWLARFLVPRYYKIGPALLRHYKAILTVTGISFFLLVDIPYLIKDYPTLNSATGKYWLQTIAGNWSPPQDAANGGGLSPPQDQPSNSQTPEPVTSPYGYAFSVILAILLNNTLYAVIITLVWRIITDRSKLMDFAQAVKNRDAIATTSIRTAIGKFKDLDDIQKEQLAEATRDAFNQGVKEWEDTYLVLAVGPEEAKRILGIFRGPN
jgi:hypothetical protein